MSIIIFLVFGAFIGWLTSLIMGSNNRQNLLGDVILGTLGSLAGGLLMDFFGRPGVTGINLYSIVVALIGSIVLVLIGRAFSRTF